MEITQPLPPSRRQLPDSEPSTSSQTQTVPAQPRTVSPNTREAEDVRDGTPVKCSREAKEVRDGTPIKHSGEAEDVREGIPIELSREAANVRRHSNRTFQRSSKCQTASPSTLQRSKGSQRRHSRQTLQRSSKRQMAPPSNAPEKQRTSEVELPSKTQEKQEVEHSRGSWPRLGVGRPRDARGVTMTGKQPFRPSVSLQTRGKDGKGPETG